MAIFWVVTPCTFVKFYRCFRGAFCPWNVGKRLPDYKAQQLRKQPSSYSPPKEHQISIFNKFLRSFSKVTLLITCDSRPIRKCECSPGLAEVENLFRNACLILFNCSLSSALAMLYYVMSNGRMKMHNELVIIWMKAIANHSKTLYQHLAGRPEEKVWKICKNSRPSS
jgi:hypothetical protein